METNIMVYLTEEVVRKIVRQELQEVLIEEGMMQDIADWAGSGKLGKAFRNSIGIAMLLAALKPTEIAEATPANLGADSEQTQSLFQELGIKNFNALANDPFTPEDKKQLQSVYEKLRPYQERLEKIRAAKQTLEQQYQETDDEQRMAEIKSKYQQAKELEDKTGREISTVLGGLQSISDKVISQGDLTSIILKNAAENDGDLSQVDTQKVALEMIQKYAAGDTQAQGQILGTINDTINSDLVKFAGSVTRSAGYGGVPLNPQSAFEIAASYADLNDLGLPNNPTPIDVVKALDSNKGKLMGKYSDFQTTKKYNLDGQLLVQLNGAMKENPDGYLDRQELEAAEQKTIDSYQAGLYTAEEAPANQQVTVKEMILRSNKFRGKNV